MVRFGYKLMSEEHGPLALVENARRAEAAGFDFVSISDHFHPWLEAQGHSPFAWSVLGAIACMTEKIGITTGLTCPIIRYHPAIIAQAAATIGVMSKGRFSLAIGAGERLNEHVTGDRWPSTPERHHMLRETIEICRLLWNGGLHTYNGAYFDVDRAQIYDLPEHPVPITVGASGPSSVRLAAEAADGMMATEPKPELVQSYRSQARKPGPCYLEVTLAYAPTEEAALKMAKERFSFGALGWTAMSELPTVPAFESAVKYIRPEDLAPTIAAGPDPEKHVAVIRKAVDAGFDHVVLTAVGPDQEGFIKFFERELRPRLEKLR